MLSDLVPPRLFAAVDRLGRVGDLTGGEALLVGTAEANYAAVFAPLCAICTHLALISLASVPICVGAGVFTLTLGARRLGIGRLGAPVA